MLGLASRSTFSVSLIIQNQYTTEVDFPTDPETAGRSLEEIDEIFTASKNIFDPVRVAKNLPKQHLSEFLHEEAEKDPEIRDAVQNIEHASSVSSNQGNTAKDDSVEKND